MKIYILVLMIITSLSILTAQKDTVKFTNDIFGEFERLHEINKQELAFTKATNDEFPGKEGYYDTYIYLTTSAFTARRQYEDSREKGVKLAILDGLKEVRRIYRRNLIRDTDWAIRRHHRKLDADIKALKDWLRSHENYNKEWYKPKIEDGSKTKAHLKGRLIELKREFKTKVYKLKQEFETIRDSIRQDRDEKLTKTEKVFRADIKFEAVDSLKIDAHRFDKIINDTLPDWAR